MSLMGEKGLLGQRQDSMAHWDLKVLGHYRSIICSFSALPGTVSCVGIRRIPLSSRKGTAKPHPIPQLTLVSGGHGLQGPHSTQGSGLGPRTDPGMDPAGSLWRKPPTPIYVPDTPEAGG